jgi:miniconductance mechanosensitive channel
MEHIRIFVEHIIGMIGVYGIAVPILRHIILIVVTILIAWLSDIICSKIFVPLLTRITSHTTAKWDDILFNEKFLHSACHIVPAIIVRALLPMIFYQHPIVREVLARLTAIYITIMGTRTVFVFISGFDELDDQPRRSRIQQYLRSFCGVLKILMGFVAVIIVVSIALDKSPMNLFAGLGATSAILMLVFKDTITDLVSGLRLTSNDMVHRGDWITVPGTQADGVVQDITLSTVKVRNFDNTIVTVSPSTLVSGTFQNWIGMQQSDGRRALRKFFIDFRSIKKEENGTNLGRYRQAIEEYLQNNKNINVKMMIMVRLLDATNYGLPLEVYFFLKEKDWKIYEMQLSAIMEHIYAMAEDFEINIYQQFPNQK